MKYCLSKRLASLVAGNLLLTIAVMLAQEVELSDGAFLSAPQEELSGGEFTLVGVAVNQESEEMNGGEFTLAAIVAGLIVRFETPDPPRLSVLSTDTGIIISWPATTVGFQLEHTGTLDGPTPAWLPIAVPYQTNATSISIAVPVPAEMEFFRLHKQ